MLYNFNYCEVNIAGSEAANSVICKMRCTDNSKRCAVMRLGHRNTAVSSFVGCFYSTCFRRKSCRNNMVPPQELNPKVSCMTTTTKNLLISFHWLESDSKWPQKQVSKSLLSCRKQGGVLPTADSKMSIALHTGKSTGSSSRKDSVVRWGWEFVTKKTSNWSRKGGLLTSPGLWICWAIAFIMDKLLAVDAGWAGTCWFKGDIPVKTPPWVKCSVEEHPRNSYSLGGGGGELTQCV